jgi:hypothetical protein
VRFLLPFFLLHTPLTDSVFAGTAQVVLIQFLKSYIAAGEPIDPVLVALRKAGLADLDQFFPAGKRSAADVTVALKGAGLTLVSDWFIKTKTAGVRDEVNKKVKSLLADNADVEEVLSVVETIAARSVPSVISEGDFVSLVFLALVSRVNLNAEGAVAADEALAQVKDYAGALEPFAQKAVSEVALMFVLFSLPYVPSFPLIVFSSTATQSRSGSTTTPSSSPPSSASSRRFTARMSSRPKPSSTGTRRVASPPVASSFSPRLSPSSSSCRSRRARMRTRRTSKDGSSPFHCCFSSLLFSFLALSTNA